ncbi:MAG: UV DNA damage repair endonuclease UvsE [candidate division WOR-3 bacterium]|nr:MAG: UV DNA damage repair endonuclease UvsE [candidate division WOR-3 bacterium]
MKIGYPCLNRTLSCSSARTFRLRSYSEERLVSTVKNNLECLTNILKYNKDHTILFFRITSDLVPFASHPVNKVPWQRHFRDTFARIGRYIKKHDMRISMHPDQFTLLNSVDRSVLRRSLKELKYHAEILDLMQLDTTAKIQLHVGGVYGDKTASMKRFALRYLRLEPTIRRRLVIENDHRNYSIADCISLSRTTGIPVVFDVFHHRVYNNGEGINPSLNHVCKTWHKRDGLLMVDYSLQKRSGITGQHAESININNFRKFLQSTKSYDFDIMLEIKNKEQSALQAIRCARTDQRFVRGNGHV